LTMAAGIAVPPGPELASTSHSCNELSFGLLPTRLAAEGCFWKRKVCERR
jgi:hypothetical protein